MQLRSYRGFRCSAASRHFRSKVGPWNRTSRRSGSSWAPRRRCSAGSGRPSYENWEMYSKRHNGADQNDVTPIGYCYDITSPKDFATSKT